MKWLYVVQLHRRDSGARHKHCVRGVVVTAMVARDGADDEADDDADVDVDVVVSIDRVRMGEIGGTDAMTTKMLWN